MNDDSVTPDGPIQAPAKVQAALIRQLTSFFGVGVLATGLHYCVLVTLVQGFRASPVPAAVIGCSAGAVLSYILNRKHTFDSTRPHEEAAWRFALVAGVAFILTYLLMRLMVEVRHMPYLAAQVITTGVVMVWTYGANRLWTFRVGI